MKISSCLILAPHVISLSISDIFFSTSPPAYLAGWEDLGLSQRKNSTEQGSLSPENNQAGRGRDLLTSLFSWPFPPCR